ncbi:MAG: diacylglycerol kinase family protein [Oscillospiraceae bacterium]|nr:diacylglycerol kinase family protein [Oscillospiraceae bacterium]
MKRELKDLGKSFKNAARGLGAVTRHERNFRIHIVMMLYVIFFSVIGRAEKGDVACFVLCFGIMLAAELVNTAIELLCNEVTREYSERVRDIKDIAAGAVLVSAIASAAVGLLTFLSPDVFWRVMTCFSEQRAVLGAFLISIPIAIFFIFKRGKK